jgi:sulfur carrier protein
MKLIVNGHEKEFQDNTTLLVVLEKLDLIDKVMAAAVNMNIIKQDSWDSYILKDGDKLELLDFVGGG